jgi:hypothetical protein
MGTGGCGSTGSGSGNWPNHFTLRKTKHSHKTCILAFFSVSTFVSLLLLINLFFLLVILVLIHLFCVFLVGSTYSSLLAHVSSTSYSYFPALSYVSFTSYNYFPASANVFSTLYNYFSALASLSFISHNCYKFFRISLCFFPHRTTIVPRYLTFLLH